MNITEEMESAIETAGYEDVKGSPAPAKRAVELIERHFEESDPEWEFYLERIAEAAPLSTRSFTSHLKTRPAVGGPIDEMTPQRYGLDARWKRLFALCKNYIHAGQFDEALKILEDYVDEFVLVDDDFRSRPMYLHLKSEILKNTGGENDIREAFRLALEAKNGVSDHPGIENNIGEITCVALAGDIPLIDLHQMSSSEDDVIKFGIINVKDAIENHPKIPAYHATFGRLLSLNGDFKEARDQLNKAIRLADPDRDRYNIRVSRYQRFLSQTELHHQEQELGSLSKSMGELKDSIQERRDEVERLQEESENRYQELESKYNEVLRDFQARNLQFIGFFAALVAVVIAIVDISISMPYPEAAGLILLLIGGVLLAFAGLQNALPTTDEGIQPGVAANAIVGVLLILAGLFVPSIIPI